MATLTDVSADGALDARYLNDRRGVLLRAKFPEQNLMAHDFEGIFTPVTHSANGISGAFVWKRVESTGKHYISYDPPGTSASAIQWASCVFKSNGTAITVDSATVAQVTSTTGLAGAATAAFNTPANATVVVLIGYDAAAGDAAGDKIAVTNNKSLSVVEVVERGHKDGGVNGGVAIAYMQSVGAQTGMTVTVTQTGVNATNDDLTFKVLILGNVSTTTPVPDAVDEGSSVANLSLHSATSSTVTQGLAVWAINDWNGLGAPSITTPETAWTVSSGTGTLSFNTTAPLGGGRDLKLAWTTAGSQAVKRTLSAAEQIPGGKLIKIQFSILTTDPPTAPNPRNTGYYRLRVLIRDKNGKVTDNRLLPHPGLSTTRTNWFTEFWLNSAYTMGSVEIFIDDAAASKQFQIDNFKIIVPAPPKIRFIRKTDGGYVRGGDPAVAVQGTAYAFDDELTPGQLTFWSAQPVWDTEWKQPIPLYFGAETGTVDFTIEDRDPTLPSHLIKSVETPGLLLYLASNQKTISRSRQAVFVNKQTTGKPAGGVTSAYSMSGDYQIITQTIADKNTLETILEDSVLYVSPPGRYNRRPFYATVTGYKTDDFARMDAPEKTFTMSFQEVERPDTFGQPNFLPLHDYDWLSTQYATYGDAGLTALTYDQLAFSAVP